VLAGSVLVIGLIGLWSTAASAHVTVHPDEAPQGGYTKLTFQVPNESDSADTISLKVQLPPDHPLASVSVKPKAGWSYEVEKTTLATPITRGDRQITEAASTITWTGGTIKPGEFDDFEISIGPLPTDTDELTFKAIQGYSDNTTVDWIETPSADGDEPEHPAPVLTLTAATGDDHGSTATSTTVSAAPAASADASSSDLAAKVTSAQDDADTNHTLAVAGIAIGVVGLIVAVVAVVLARRHTSTT
jgi:uncharacterized protein